MPHGFSSVSLLGFSQGMAMATTLMRPAAFAAGVGLSGFVLHNELLGALEPLEPKVPFYWARDTAELVINPDATAFTAEWLAANTELSQAHYPGLGHNTGPVELRDAAAFLAGLVPGPFVPRG
ncbi:alpha/beta hydrolase [Arthrobacter sp. STN4]|uniref:alpha/beta hydrolase n=1 Tax=Arthrobacter sp. STN4 TaxID=2923276 RepID=UPI00277B53B5|nr:hypothetical protein [Arthrobacter sp. STN4]